MLTRFGHARAFETVASPRDNGGQSISPAQNLPVQRPGATGNPVDASTVAEPHRYAWLISGQQTVDTLPNPGIGYSPTVPVLLQSSTLRNFLYLKVATASLWQVGFAFGKPVDLANPDWILGPGGFLAFDTVVPQNDIYAASLSGVFGNTSLFLWNYSTIQITPR